MIRTASVRIMPRLRAFSTSPKTQRLNTSPGDHKPQHASGEVRTGGQEGARGESDQRWRYFVGGTLTLLGFISLIAWRNQSASPSVEFKRAPGEVGHGIPPNGTSVKGGSAEGGGENSLMERVKKEARVKANRAAGGALVEDPHGPGYGNVSGGERR